MRKTIKHFLIPMLFFFLAACKPGPVIPPRVESAASQPSETEHPAPSAIPATGIPTTSISAYPPAGAATPTVTRTVPPTIHSATRTAEALARAPTARPLPTHTPLPEGSTCFVNRTAGFSLLMPPGWFTYPGDWFREYNSIFYNYHPELFGSEGFPDPKMVKIDVSIYPLEEGKSFEQVVAAGRAAVNLPDEPPVEMSEARPYRLGTYEGVAYTVYGFTDVFVISLFEDGKVIQIGVLPANSTSFDEAISILETLDISGRDSCYGSG